MQLSFSTNAFTRAPLLAAIEAIAAAGFAGVEILADQPHLFSTQVGPETVGELRQALVAAKLKVANLNANTVIGYYGRTFWEPLFEPSLANAAPQARSWRIDYTVASLHLAQALGCPCISVTAGRPQPGLLPEESLTLLVDSLEIVLRHAAQTGVKVGIEYEPGLLVENGAELVRLLEVVDSPWLGANLDIGHSHVAGEDLDQVAASLAGKIFHVHLEDIRQRKHYHRIPGDGDLDFPRILATLQRQSYDGYVTVELYTYPHQPEEAARRSWQHLAPLPFWH